MKISPISIKSNNNSLKKKPPLNLKKNVFTSKKPPLGKVVNPNQSSLYNDSKKKELELPPLPPKPDFDLSSLKHETVHKPSEFPPLPVLPSLSPPPNIALPLIPSQCNDFDQLPTFPYPSKDSSFLSKSQALTESDGVCFII
jgi:hypothetical protein